MVARLEEENENAQRSWSIFRAGNGDHEDQRAALRQRLANTPAAHVFTDVMRICASATVLSLARMTDQPQKDRNTLFALKGLIGSIQGEIADDALNWYAHLDNSGPGSDIALGSRDSVAQELLNLTSRISALAKRNELKRLRNLRDSALAHALSMSGIGLTYDDVSFVTAEVNLLTAKAAYAVVGRHYDPGERELVLMQRANDFWSRFEHAIEANS
jgi:hypothetical protein